jgi:hypothetical protein
MSVIKLSFCNTVIYFSSGLKLFFFLEISKSSCDFKEFKKVKNFPFIKSLITFIELYLKLIENPTLIVLNRKLMR